VLNGAIRVANAGVMMHNRGDEEIRFKRRLARIGYCRRSTAKSEMSARLS
jgi:hypothetical protein